MPDLEAFPVQLTLNEGVSITTNRAVIRVNIKSNYPREPDREVLITVDSTKVVVDHGDGLIEELSL